MKCPICKKKCESLTEYWSKDGLLKRCWDCYRSALSLEMEKVGIKLVFGFEIQIKEMGRH